MDRPASRDYTGPQSNARCGGAPESTLHFSVRQDDRPLEDVLQRHWRRSDVDDHAKGLAVLDPLQPSRHAGKVAQGCDGVGERDALT